MKSLINGLVFTFFLTNVCFAQWDLTNPSTSDNDLNSISSIGNYHWAVGAKGTIVFSSNGGINWIPQNSTVTKDLNSVFFIRSHLGWIVGDEGTILRTNAGGNWELIQTLTDYNLNSVFFVSEAIGWAAGGDDVGVNSYSITLKTTDSGLTWFEQYNPSSDIKAIYFLDEDIGFTVGYNWYYNGSNIKKTTDGGLSWVNKNPNIVGHYWDIYFINESVGYCVGEKVIKTTDGGDNWTIVNGDFPFTEAIRFANDSIGWIVSARSVFRTSDGGDNWMEFNLPELKSRHFNCTNYNSISIIDTNTVYIAADHGTIIKSMDMGLSWLILSGILNDIFKVQFVDSLNGFIAASNGCIYNTNDGGVSWSAKVTPTDRDILNLLLINQTTGFATSDNEILKSYDGGQTWWKKSYIPNHQSLILNDIYFVDNLNGWACGNYSTIIHSSNGGESWQVQLEDNGFAEIKSIYFHDELNGLAIGENYGPTGLSYFLYKTTDGGNNWIKNDLQIEGYGEGKILFLNEQEGWLLLDDRIMSTSDGGASWQLNFTANDLWGALDICVVDQDKLWITTWYGIILNSTNKGETWGIQGNYDQPYHWLRSINMYNDQIGWIVGSPNVIYKTYNGGQGIIEPPTTPVLNLPLNGAFLQEWFGYSWTAREDCLTRLQISTYIDFQSLEFEGLYINNFADAYYTCNYIKHKKYYWRVRSENQLGVSEWSEVRYFTTDIQPSGIEEEINSLQYSLLQNYPNPFNPVTKIRYSIPQTSKVIIKIFDVLGREMTTLVNEEKPVGTYELIWSAANLPSGVYFYQIKAGKFIQAKKMILLK